MPYIDRSRPGTGRPKGKSWQELYSHLPTIEHEDWDRDTHWSVPMIASQLGINTSTVYEKLATSGVEPLGFVKVKGKGRHRSSPLFSPTDISTALFAEKQERVAVNKQPQRRAPSQQRMKRGIIAGDRAEQVARTHENIRTGKLSFNPSPVAESEPEDGGAGRTIRVRGPEERKAEGATSPTSGNRMTIPRRPRNLSNQFGEDDGQLSLF